MQYTNNKTFYPAGGRYFSKDELEGMKDAELEAALGNVFSYLQNNVRGGHTRLSVARIENMLLEQKADTHRGLHHPPSDLNEEQLQLQQDYWNAMPTEGRKFTGYQRLETLINLAGNIDRGAGKLSDDEREVYLNFTKKFISGLRVVLGQANEDELRERLHKQKTPFQTAEEACYFLSDRLSGTRTRDAIKIQDGIEMAAKPYLTADKMLDAMEELTQMERSIFERLYSLSENIQPRTLITLRNSDTSGQQAFDRIITYFSNPWLYGEQGLLLNARQAERNAKYDDEYRPHVEYLASLLMEKDMEHLSATTPFEAHSAIWEAYATHDDMQHNDSAEEDSHSAGATIVLTRAKIALKKSTVENDTHALKEAINWLESALPARVIKEAETAAEKGASLLGGCRLPGVAMLESMLERLR